MTDDDISFVNMDSWKGSGSKFGLTMKQIILSHIQRTVVNGSCEFRGGYNKEILTGNRVSYEYVPDSREVYSNSVRMLRAIMLCYFDKQMKQADEELQKEFEQLYQDYRKRCKEGEDRKQAKEIFRDEKIDWYIKLFEELVKLSKRLNFFEEESSEEEL